MMIIPYRDIFIVILQQYIKSIDRCIFIIFEYIRSHSIKEVRDPNREAKEVHMAGANAGSTFRGKPQAPTKIKPPPKPRYPSK